MGTNNEALKIAEHVFLVLAREWQDTSNTVAINCPLPASVDLIALSCLLLAVEWGSTFTSPQTQTILAENARLALSRWPESHFGAWEAMPWNLCKVNTPGDCGRKSALKFLNESLTHSSSAVRIWAMKVAWVIRPWLSIKIIVPAMLRNIADTLGGVRLAVGLARGICESDEQLETFISAYTPPVKFATQFSSRIKSCREEGFFISEAALLSLECQCRQIIEKAVLGLAVSPTLAKDSWGSRSSTQRVLRDSVTGKPL